MTGIETPPEDRKTALAPDLRSMPDRAARAWAERMAVRPLPDGRYAVDSASGATYVVDTGAGTCTCPDSTIRGETCKHRRRVAIEITTGRVPPPGLRAGTCLACGREAFVPVDGPALCAACHLQRGDVVRDRETGDRLVVRRVSSDPADEVAVPGTEWTVADYPTNEGYPGDDPVVEAVYLRAWREEDPRVYRFPHSRLAATGAAMLDS
jgi:hypothetical protein